MIRVGIVGATGYSGVELIRLLVSHPHVKVANLYSSTSEGESLASVFPHVQALELPVLAKIDAGQMGADNDVIFLATPAGVSAELSPELVKNGAKVIDLSGDFRLKDGAAYTQWYKRR